MTEVWKAVVGHEGRYLVSNLGRVWSVRYRHHPGGRLLKLTPVPSGHLTVNLHANDVKKTWHVHRLVMNAFVGPKPRGLETRHLDGNPANNELSNLQYATRSRNALDRKWHGGHPCHKLRPKDVRAIRRRLAAYSWGLIATLAREYDVTPPTISMIRRGLVHGDVL